MKKSIAIFLVCLLCLNVSGKILDSNLFTDRAVLRCAVPKGGKPFSERLDTPKGRLALIFFVMSKEKRLKNVIEKYTVIAKLNEYAENLSELTVFFQTTELYRGLSVHKQTDFINLPLSLVNMLHELNYEIKKCRDEG